MEKFHLAAVVTIVLLATTPASAKMLPCTAANMATSMTTMPSMPEGPGKAGMMKEMGMANASMAKGDMRGACKSYMRAQKVAAKK